MVSKEGLEGGEFIFFASFADVASKKVNTFISVGFFLFLFWLYFSYTKTLKKF